MKLSKENIQILIAALALVCIFVYIMITAPMYRIASEINSVSTEIGALNSHFESLVQVQVQGKGEADASSVNLGNSIAGLKDGLNDLSNKLSSTNQEFKNLNENIGSSTLLRF